MTIPATKENVAKLNEFLAKRGGDPVELPPDAPAAPMASEVPPTPAEPTASLGEPEVIDEETQAALAALDDADEVDAEAKPSIDLAALAEHLGLESGDFSLDERGRVRLRTKIDGQENEVSLGELRKGYQLQKHFTQQQENFLREKSQWEQRKASEEENYRNQMALAHEVLVGQEEALKREYTKDWSVLRRDDPAEYAAQVAEYNQRLNDIRGRRSQLQQELQRKQAEYQQQWQTQYQDTLARESRKLVEALGLEDGKATDEQRQQRFQGITEYLGKQGFQPQDLQGIVDHRAYLMIDKARRYDELMAKVSKAKAKLSAPTPVPEGNRAVTQSAVAATEKKVAALEKRAIETGTREDQRAAFRAILNQKAQARR